MDKAYRWYTVRQPTLVINDKCDIEKKVCLLIPKKKALPTGEGFLFDYPYNDNIDYNQLSTFFFR